MSYGKAYYSLSLMTDRDIASRHANVCFLKGGKKRERDGEGGGAEECLFEGRGRIDTRTALLFARASRDLRFARIFSTLEFEFPTPIPAPNREWWFSE